MLTPAVPLYGRGVASELDDSGTGVLAETEREVLGWLEFGEASRHLAGEVVESGFENTSDPSGNLEAHRQGWDGELDKLVALFEGGA